MSWHHNYKAWLDEDGKHIWFQHECKERVVEISMLPFPHWHEKPPDSNSFGRFVEPSIVCNACGFHEIVRLGEHP